MKRTNRLPKTGAASKLGKGRVKQKENSSSTTRSAEAIQRLKMYSNGKAIRDKKGKIVAGSHMMDTRAGDREITAATGRIQPDRRWFGNTRVVDPQQLDAFRTSMLEQQSDPYSVVLKRHKVPLGLLKEAAEYSTQNKRALLEQEPFEQAFSHSSRRKRVKLDQLFVARSDVKNLDQKSTETGKAETPVQSRMDYSTLLQTAQKSHDTYEEINNRDDIVPWGKDHQIMTDRPDWRPERKDDLFLKGQSKRIWGEFFKVVDSSDVILHVIDARNVPGTRCTMIEKHIAKHASHKHLVFVLNKIDLVPSWVAKRWLGELAKSRPTIAFHASLTHAFGKGALISLLRQFGKLHSDKKEIAVGVIGYPNVGKSSVINTLISQKSCKVAPVPGETKIWQYVSLFKRISLIDCPGVVVDTAGDTETDSVLKGVVRAERLEHPDEFIDTILENVKPEYIKGQYKLTEDWESSTELLEMIAKRAGRLRKGGDPCTRTAAVQMINDYQRGRLPHYVAPPELKSDDDVERFDANIIVPVQDLNELEKDVAIDGEAVAQDDEDSSRRSIDTETGDDSRFKDEEDSKPAGVPDSSELIGDGEWD
ncbi:nuclear GTP-binding protein [Fistulifera solaris]|uniref:Nucleolar GTP-binding protein 2 n=1 Tax=Fistulifera solaris TaxID=1519565 RepID=A0A1Z5KER4_FISSO|nr:nuclear GTP-binding protein [Fistulifera solaris]|eukprot:GAX24773.1 nuclear GTP-binding protein [Fistulifera solaris]